MFALELLDITCAMTETVADRDQYSINAFEAKHSIGKSPFSLSCSVGVPLILA